MENAAPLPTPRLPTRQEAAVLNSKRSSSTPAEASAQADHLRQMRMLESQKHAATTKRS
ncbi:MAG: hypothetical protein K9N47_11640 [Prosthecobacter sp.]|uniref:hypothetical protein n=1 Tax=Prosthecobacter sp. TaxID=1965333 RepID=UPI0025FDC1AF|nr:hypothetical protein [Prosthecobacter sp.]MCF7786767.1 hypothetical protein [Prosthecobacter sp.]